MLLSIENRYTNQLRLLKFLQFNLVHILVSREIYEISSHAAWISLENLKIVTTVMLRLIMILRSVLSPILKSALYKAVVLFAHFTVCFLSFLLLSLSLISSYTLPRLLLLSFLRIWLEREDQRPKQCLPLPRVSRYTAIPRANTRKVTFSKFPIPQHNST